MQHTCTCDYTRVRVLLIGLFVMRIVPLQDLTFLLQSVRDRLSGCCFVPIHHLDTCFVVDETYWSESEWLLSNQVVEVYSVLRYMHCVCVLIGIRITLVMKMNMKMLVFAH